MSLAGQSVLCRVVSSIGSSKESGVIVSTEICQSSEYYRLLDEPTDNILLALCRFLFLLTFTLLDKYLEM